MIYSGTLSCSSILIIQCHQDTRERDQYGYRYAPSHTLRNLGNAPGSFCCWIDQSVSGNYTVVDISGPDWKASHLMLVPLPLAHHAPFLPRLIDWPNDFCLNGPTKDFYVTRVLVRGRGCIIPISDSLEGKSLFFLPRCLFVEGLHSECWYFISWERTWFGDYEVWVKRVFLFMKGKFIIDLSSLVLLNIYRVAILVVVIYSSHSQTLC